MWYDIVALVILIYSTVRGAITGLVWQLAVIGAIVGCFVFSGPLSHFVAPLIPVKSPLNKWIAMLVIYLAFAFVCFVIARQVKDWIKKARFVEYDRHVGAILGFLKGAAVCILLTFFGATLSANLRPVILNSYSGHLSVQIINRLCPVVPSEWHEVLEPYLNRIGHSHDTSPTPDRPKWDAPFRPENSPDSNGSTPESSGDFDWRSQTQPDSEPLENPGNSDWRI